MTLVVGMMACSMFHMSDLVARPAQKDYMACRGLGFEEYFFGSIQTEMNMPRLVIYYFFIRNDEQRKLGQFCVFSFSEGFEYAIPLWCWWFR